jgi:hypothetical protein
MRVASLTSFDFDLRNRENRRVLSDNNIVFAANRRPVAGERVQPQTSFRTKTPILQRKLNVSEIFR